MKKQKLLIGLYCTLIALCVSSISVSFAWYEESNRKRVDKFDITLKTYADLAISTDGKNFKETLTDKDLGYSNKLYFSPVSPRLDDNWLDKENPLPLFYQNTTEGTVNIMTVKSGFLCQKIYLKPHFDGKITFDINPKDKPLFAPNVEFNSMMAKQLSLDNGLSEEDNLKELNKITNSIRMSVLYFDEESSSYKYLIVDPYKDESLKTPLFGTLDLTKDGYYDFSGDKEIVYGNFKDKDKLIYDTSSPSDSPFKEEKLPSAFNAKTKKGIRKFNEKASLENGFAGLYEESITLKELKEQFHINVKKDDIKSLYICIYFEGWDKDNIEETKSAGFNANIKFRATVESFE